MDEQQREELVEQLAELDDAMAELEKARAPFDKAISALYGMKERLLERHETDIAGNCESCMTVIFEGDLAHRSEDFLLCADCAPTWGDCKKSWEEAVERGDIYHEDKAKDALASIESYIAGGGSLEDKNVAQA